MKDYQIKFSKINTGAIQGFSGGGGEKGDEDGETNTGNLKFEKLCSNDKVIQSIRSLINKTKEENDLRSKEVAEIKTKLDT